METLPDYLGAGMQIMAVGLNPSPNSVREGYPFATRQNRFWRALNTSRLVNAQYAPGVAAMWELLHKERIGFTDIVKKPTAGAAELRAGDYKTWAPVLVEKILRYQPPLVWFQGKLAYTNFLRHGLQRNNVTTAWGAQGEIYPGIEAFVTPNPSAANAAFSLADIVSAFDEMAEYLRR